MVECDGYVRWNSRLGLGHISWVALGDSRLRLGTNEAKGTIGRIWLHLVCELCVCFPTDRNPILQDLRGKSRLLFVYEFLKWLTNNIALLKKYWVINETLLKNCWVINEKCMIYNKAIPYGTTLGDKWGI